MSLSEPSAGSHLPSPTLNCLTLSTNQTLAFESTRFLGLGPGSLFLEAFDLSGNIGVQVSPVVPCRATVSAAHVSGLFLGISQMQPQFPITSYQRSVRIPKLP
jgi:hypothetical protein